MTPQRIAELREGSCLNNSQEICDALDESLDEIERLRALVERLATAHPMEHHDDDGRCWNQCHHCDRDEEFGLVSGSRVVQHKADCLTIEARRVLGMPVPWEDDGVRHEVQG